MAIFTNEFIENEINCLDYQIPDDETLDRIRERAEETLLEDEFTFKEMLEHIDSAIARAGLEEY